MLLAEWARVCPPGGSDTPASTVSQSRERANWVQSSAPSAVQPAWTRTDRLLARATAWALFGVGLMYILTTTAGFVIAGGLQAPIVAEVNRVVRGWGAYFRVGNSTRKFRAIDRFVRERLVIFLVNKARRGERARKRHTWALLEKLGVYRLQGTVTWATATPKAVR